MTTDDKAPDFTDGRPDQGPGYPSGGKKLGPAWQEIWDMLRANPGGLDRITLAEAVAPKYDLQVSSLLVLIARAAKAGVLRGHPAPYPITASRVVNGTTVRYATRRTRTVFTIAPRDDG